MSSPTGNWPQIHALAPLLSAVWHRWGPSGFSLRQTTEKRPWTMAFFVTCPQSVGTMATSKRWNNGETKKDLCNFPARVRPGQLHLLEGIGPSQLLKNISQLGPWFPIYGKIKSMFQTTNQISLRAAHQAAQLKKPPEHKEPQGIPLLVSSLNRVLTCFTTPLHI